MEQLDPGKGVVESSLTLSFEVVRTKPRAITMTR